MKISIVIPNWNGAEKIKRHIPNVIQAAQNFGVKEIIVVDDGSTDDSVNVLKKDFSQITLIEKKINSGFSSTVNLGVANATGELVVLLNNDASPSGDFLKFLVPHFDNPKVFSVGCNVGGLWSVAKFTDGYFWHDQAKEENKPSKAHRTLWVSGGSGIFRKSIWQELKGLDPLYDPFYEEDLDMGYRANKRGYINLWEPNSLVEHYQEEGVIAKNFKKSTIDSVAQRNQLIFIWKNITSKDLFNQHKKALIGHLIAHPKYWKIFLMAISKLSEIRAKREIEKKEGKMTDEEVLELFD